MKRGLQLLLAGLCVVLAGTTVLADAPWQVTRVTKQDEGGKVLRIMLDVTTTDAVNWSNFIVVNEQGEKIADAPTYNKKQSFVEFQGDWSDMIGRYLENGDVRVPLFQMDAPVEVTPAVAPEIPVVERPVIPEVRTPVVPEVRTPVVVEDVDRPVYVDSPRDVEHRYVGDGRRDVYHHGTGGHTTHVHGDRDVHHHADGDHAHHGSGTHVHGDGCGCDKCAASHGSGHGAGCGCEKCVASHGGHGGGGDGCGCGGSGCADCGKDKANPWAIDPLGKAYGQGMKLAMGDVPGSGSGTGSGSGYGTGSGSGSGDGCGSGPGEGTGSGDGAGPGEGCADGCTDGPSPEEGPNPNEATGPNEGMGPNEGNGEGEGYGPGPGGGGRNMANMRNLAPQYKQRVRNLAPKLKLPKVPTFYGPDILTYNPQIPYWNPNIPYYSPGYGYGYGGGGGYGGGNGGGGMYPPISLEGADFGIQKMDPGMVLYISCGDDRSSGKVYQVDEQGRVLGMVNLPATATGLAMHKEHGLICTTPREGGKVYRIDDGGEVELVLEDDSNMVHPVDVGVDPNGDSMVVADNISNSLLLTNTAGRPAEVFKKFDGANFQNQKMSVAIARDKSILLGTEGNRGVYRYTGVESTQSTPILMDAGAVAADPASDRWAATQGNDEVVVMEDDQKVATYKLPAGKVFHLDGMLSFAPPAGVAEDAPNTGVVVAMRDADDANAAPYLMEFKTTPEGKVNRRLLFDWKQDKMVDFVVGPRMYWEKNKRDTYKGIY
ncbi:MAG: hypothetical protein Q4C96_02650 [Planctomycetia bacterium]|nr:hypothetical protein [Planctomycetia bacterium]